MHTECTEECRYRARQGFVITGGGKAAIVSYMLSSTAVEFDGHKLVSCQDHGTGGGTGYSDHAKEVWCELSL